MHYPSRKYITAISQSVCSCSVPVAFLRTRGWCCQPAARCRSPPFSWDEVFVHSTYDIVWSVSSPCITIANNFATVAYSTQCTHLDPACARGAHPVHCHTSKSPRYAITKSALCVTFAGDSFCRQHSSRRMPVSTAFPSHLKSSSWNLLLSMALISSSSTVWLIALFLPAVSCLLDPTLPVNVGLSTAQTLGHAASTADVTGRSTDDDCSPENVRVFSTFALSICLVPLWPPTRDALSKPS
jgi:hypothetical protein